MKVALVITTWGQSQYKTLILSYIRRDRTMDLIEGSLYSRNLRAVYSFFQAFWHCWSQFYFRFSSPSRPPALLFVYWLFMTAMWLQEAKLTGRVFFQADIYYFLHIIQYSITDKIYNSLFTQKCLFFFSQAYKTPCMTGSWKEPRKEQTPKLQNAKCFTKLL